MQPEVILALSTEATADKAQALARQVLERGLAACVSVQPLRSLYVWQGQLEQGEEVQLLFKTDAQRLPALAELVHQLHSYETPEWLSWPAAASRAYGGWMQTVLSSDAWPAGPSDPSAAEGPAG